MNKFKLVAGIAAAVVMGGSLTYYNFIDKPDVSKVTVGEECPNFIAKVYKSEGDKFYVSDEILTLVTQRGKVCVINFWETWCSGCIKELPDFERIQKDYADSVKVVAVVGNTSSAEGAAEWMSSKGWLAHDDKSEWTNFSLTFAYLPKDVCTSFGCTGPLPRTVIVDKAGVVAYEKDASLHYDELQALINGLL